MTSSSILYYLKNTKPENWDFGTCIDTMKEESACNNTSAYAKLETLLKKHFNNNFYSKYMDQLLEIISKEVLKV